MTLSSALFLLLLVDVPFTHGEYSLSNANHNWSFMSITPSSISADSHSAQLKNAILNTRPCKRILDCFMIAVSIEVDGDWDLLFNHYKSLTVKEGTLNSVKEEVSICNFPHLTSITFHINSFQNTKRLVICNNTLLQSIIIFNGTDSSVNAALRAVDSLVFESPFTWDL